jgi:hypothetical protein
LHGIWLKKKDKPLPCPTCGAIIKCDSQKDPISALPKNFSLLALISEKSSKKSIVRGMILQSPSEIAEAEKALEKCKGICPTHKRQIHSYISGNNVLLCESCISSVPKNSTVYPIPSVFLIFYYENRLLNNSGSN